MASLASTSAYTELALLLDVVIQVQGLPHPKPGPLYLAVLHPLAPRPLAPAPTCSDCTLTPDP